MTNVLVTGDCAPLQVAVTNSSGDTSCVGDLVTYTCTLPSVAHTWSIPSFGFMESITRETPTFDDPASQFFINTTADGGGANPITTALSVTSFAGLDETNIICSDANQITSEAQDAIAMVFGRCSLCTRGNLRSHPILPRKYLKLLALCATSHTHS